MNENSIMCHLDVQRERYRGTARRTPAIGPMHGGTAAAAFLALVSVMVGVLLGLLGVPCLAVPAQADGAPAPSSAPDLVYVSDYVSFVGADGQGHVAFALDNNRGRDGEAYQAEHFLVLHDEGRGWVDLAGNGAYENHGKQLADIPDSSAFQFEGAPRTGMTITSPPNDLVLHVEPIPERLARADGDARYWMGSAPAMLEWAGRRLSGRVIYEYLYKPGFNRLTRTYFGLWNDFQGFYLSIGETGDFYLHSQQSEQLAPLTGNLAGFAVIDGRRENLEDLEFIVRNRQFTLGFYRWPVAWRICWKGEEPSAIAFTLSERKVLANWVIGGFAMGIVKGEIERDGRTYPFYGLAELIM